MKLDTPLNLNFILPDSQNVTPALQAHTTENHQKKIDELNKELQAKSRQIDTKNQENGELRIKILRLQEENRKTQERQKLMDEELRKAEAQIGLIMELIGER